MRIKITISYLILWFIIWWSFYALLTVLIPWKTWKECGSTRRYSSAKISKIYPGETCLSLGVKKYVGEDGREFYGPESTVILATPGFDGFYRRWKWRLLRSWWERPVVGGSDVIDFPVDLVDYLKKERGEGE